MQILFSNISIVLLKSELKEEVKTQKNQHR